MEETVRQELLAKTKQALDADEWNAVERIWQPWIEQGEAEAEFQLAYHYLRYTSCEDDATRERMEALVNDGCRERSSRCDLLSGDAFDVVRRRRRTPNSNRLLAAGWPNSEAWKHSVASA